MNFKKLIVVLSLAIIGSFAFSQTVSKASIETGWMPYTVVGNTRDADQFMDVFYTRLLVQYAPSFFPYFFIGGQITTTMSYDDRSYNGSYIDILPSFVPMTDSFQFFMGLRIKNFELGVRHECSHPLDVWGIQSIVLNEAYTMCYARIDLVF